MLTRRQAELAAEIMGVSLEGLTSKILGEAYKKLVLVLHPDAGGATEDFVKLQQAKKDLVKWLDNLSQDGLDSTSPVSGCERCGGKGYIRVTRGFSSMTIKCLRCEPKE